MLPSHLLLMQTFPLGQLYVEVHSKVKKKIYQGIEKISNHLVIMQSCMKYSYNLPTQRPVSLSQER